MRKGSDGFTCRKASEMSVRGMPCPRLFNSFLARELRMASWMVFAIITPHPQAEARMSNTNTTLTMVSACWNNSTGERR